MFNPNTPKSIKSKWYRDNGNEYLAKSVDSSIIDQQKRAIGKVREWVDIPLDDIAWDNENNQMDPNKNAILNQTSAAVEFSMFGWVSKTCLAWVTEKTGDRMFGWDELGNCEKTLCMAKWLYDKKEQEKINKSN